MFLHILNDTQQTAFLALARQFIAADQRLSAEEQNLLELAYAETGQDFDVELPTGDLDSLLQPFDSAQSKAAVLLELIGMGHADNEFHADESRLLREVAEGLGVPEAKVRAMEAWVERQLALAQEVEGFWSE
jgi:uncharacterized tellurite resistance protein B-like protein